MGFDAVVDSARLNGALTATAEAIRSKTDSTEPIMFDMDEGFKSAVDGIEIGGDTETAYNEGIEQGKKAQYDEFWDSYQQNGNRTAYAQSFYSAGWTDITFKPKYDIVCTDNSYGVFSYSRIIEIQKKVDIASATNIGYFFYNNFALKTIKKLVVSNNTPFETHAFGGCNELENITIEGVIAQNGLDLHWSTKLSKASITSIINCLSTTTGGLTVTLSKTAKETSFTADEWTALANTRPNWTITLV